MSGKVQPYPIFTIDWVVVVIYILLLVFGWFSICGATHDIGDTDFFSWDSRTGKQLVWMACAGVLAFVILMTEIKEKKQGSTIPLIRIANPCFIYAFIRFYIRFLSSCIL